MGEAADCACGVRRTVAEGMPSRLALSAARALSFLALDDIVVGYDQRLDPFVERKVTGQVRCL